MPKDSGSVVALVETNPKLGDTVTFATEYDVQDRYRPYVWVQVLAYNADGSIVWGQANYPDKGFLLGGTASPWKEQGGPAHCVAMLYYWAQNGKMIVLATDDFEAAG
jgi:hypothetical protein